MARRLVFSAPQQVAIEETALAAPGPGQGSAHSILSGISHGTEMTGFLGTTPFLSRTLTPERTFRPKTPEDPSFYPFYFAGYDCVATVTAIGAGVTNIKPGDRIWSGTPHQTDFVFPAEDAIVLPDSVPTDEAIFINLVSIGYNAVLDAEIKLGDVVVVSGGGLIGQVVVQMAFLSGARQVFLVDPLAERREAAAARTRAIGLDPTVEPPIMAVLRHNKGNPPDVVLECSGVVKGLQAAIQTAGVNGRVVASGFYAGSAEALQLGEEFLHNRVTIRASMSVWGCSSRFETRWDRRRLLAETVNLMAERRLNLAGFISARCPFEEAQQAYEAIRDHPESNLKIVLEYNPAD